MTPRFKYYFVHDTTPVRVPYNEQGLRMGAEVPSQHSRELVPKATMLSTIMVDHEVEEIDEQEFDRLCGEYYTRWGL